MSEFHVEVNKIKNVQKHPNADTLSVAEINGYPIIFKTGDFNENDLAVHIPIDSIVPDLPEWAFLNGNRKIKAKRLRGIFSMGLVINPKPEWKKGQNVQKELGILKYEPEPEFVKVVIPKSGFRKWIWRIKKLLGLTLNEGQNEKDPGFIPVYTDIEGFRKYRNILQIEEEVILTEKLHGQNYRFGYINDKMWVGSHHMIKRKNRKNKWWQHIFDLNLEQRLKKYPDLVFYGESYGNVQDLKYGTNDIKLALFDIYDIKAKRYLDYDSFKELAKEVGLETVPELYRGPWNEDLLKLAEGQSTINGANHVREGFVVKPVRERWDITIGRVILKMVGEGYLLRKQK
jgi:tRNA-binding EMAP/Myf-like protein